MSRTIDRTAADAAEATRLLLVHAAGNDRAHENAEYVASTRRYNDDHRFRSLVDAMAEAVGTKIVSSQEREGIVLLNGPDSPFAWRWSDVLSSLDPGKEKGSISARRSQMMASMIAVVATFYPTPSSQYEESAQNATATVDECIETLQTMKQAFWERHGVSDVWPDEDDHMQLLGRVMSQVPDRAVDGADRKLATIERQVIKMLEILRKSKLVGVLDDAAESTIYVARNRFRLQIAHASNRMAIDLAQTLLARAGATAEETAR